MPGTLHLDTGREMRGGQWQVLYLVRGLTARGNPATLLARPGAPLHKMGIAEGLDVRPFSLRELMRLSSSFDLVHAHDARSHTAAAFGRVPLVVSRRVAFPIRASIGSRWKYSRPARYIAVSCFVKRMLLEAAIAEERIDVVYDGVPLPVEPRAGGLTRIIALESNDPAKGRALVEQAARRAGAPVTFSNDLAADLPSAALFVYVSELEGLGSAALLAMAHGVPVLASSAGGLPEIVEDGVTGRLTENSVEQISDKMLDMLANPGRLAVMGAAARARVERQFTMDHMVANTLAVYEKVLR